MSPVEVVRQEDVEAMIPPGSYPIWSPYDALLAAETLERMLEADREKP
jgi:hypothetical protein